MQTRGTLAYVNITSANMPMIKQLASSRLKRSLRHLTPPLDESANRRHLPYLLSVCIILEVFLLLCMERLLFSQWQQITDRYRTNRKQSFSVYCSYGNLWLLLCFFVKQYHNNCFWDKKHVLEKNGCRN